MEQLNDCRMKLMLIGIVTILVFDVRVVKVKADFTFGQPINLGPTVNSSSHDQHPSISGDGTKLYFMSRRSGGIGDWDIWVAKRKTTNDPWSDPENIGPIVNSNGEDWAPSVSSDGLELYFEANRSGGYGGTDILVASRKTIDEPWGNPVNLGSIVNSSSRDGGPSISFDGLELYFKSDRPGGYGGEDLWVSRRPTKEEPWGIPENLGPIVNGLDWDRGPSISSDGLILFFSSVRTGSLDLWLTSRETKDGAWSEPIDLGPGVNKTYTEDGVSISADGRTLYFSDYYYTGIRPGGHGGADLYKVSINPIVDFNGDMIVDVKDVMIMIEHWGSSYSLCDIGPMPWGDGIVDVEDLKVLAEYLFGDMECIAHFKLDETKGTIANDSARNYDGTVYGNPQWKPIGGVIGGALQLDGIDDYVRIGSSLNPAKGAFSIFTWIKGGAPGQAILSQADGVNWLCTDSVEGSLMTELKPTSRGGNLLSQTCITDGDWHYIGFVWDESHRYLYVDGSEVAKDTASLSGLEDAYGGLYFGTGSTLALGSFFSGLIDDVRIYNRAVSP